MTEQIISRQLISEQAHEAALTWKTGRKPPNPFPMGSAASAVWRASFERWLLLETSEEGCEGAA